MRGIHIRSQSLLRLSIAGIALLFPWATTIAQTWFKVANEGSTVTSVAPITYRYGSGSSWTAARTSLSVAVNNTTFGDPLPYAVKELDVLETSVQQTVVVDGASVVVPALNAPVATVTTKDQTISTSAPVIPAGTTICTTSKTGGACKTTTAITLAPLTAKVPGQTSPASFVPMNFTCSVQVVNGTPDLTKPMDCTVTAK